MVRLLIVDHVSSAAADHAFGGAPLVPAGHGFAWPMCRTCGGTMRHLGRVRTDDARLILLFMCDNDPGMCDEWDAEAGGNCAIIIAADGPLAEAPIPAGQAALRATQYGATVVEVDAVDYDVARERWIAETGRPGRDVLGVLGGDPSWIQGDERPTCDSCGAQMAFVTSLEEGPRPQDAMNFGGGGVGYVFACACDARSAKFLWQN